MHTYSLNRFHKVGERFPIGKVEAYATTRIHFRQQQLSWRRAVEACQ